MPPHSNFRDFQTIMPKADFPTSLPNLPRSFISSAWALLLPRPLTDQVLSLPIDRRREEISPILEEISHQKWLPLLSPMSKRIGSREFLIKLGPSAGELDSDI